MSKRYQVAIIVSGIIAGIISILSVLISVYSITSNTLPVTTPQSEIENQLLKANIVLSGNPEGVNQVRGFLINDPAYKILASNILIVMNGNGLVGNSAPLDLINGEYKKLFGVSQDDYLPAENYNDFDKLEAAIFTAWKNYNPESSQETFDEILEPQPS